jgi:predicted RNase H-like HicB family nuclease
MGNKGKHKKRIYYVAIYPDENGSYMMTFPDFPDMAADFGKNFEDCIISGENFLNDVISVMVENGEMLPEPTPPEKLRNKLSSTDDLLCIVPVTVYPPAKTERINITGKGDVFARIDDYAEKHHVTRSELMIKATLDYISAGQ